MEFELTPYLNFNKLSDSKLMSEILAINEKSCKNGLVLSNSDAQMLIDAGKESLKLNERVEFGKSVTLKIIEKFMNSTYIMQNEYADVLAELINIFYDIKDESLDMLSDDEVINFMYDFFENESGGDIEAMRNRDMEYLCRKIRNTANGIYD